MSGLALRRGARTMVAAASLVASLHCQRDRPSPRASSTPLAGPGRGDAAVADTGSHAQAEPRRTTPLARRIDAQQPWALKNRLEIDRMMELSGRGSSAFDAAHPPVAVFDCDNTLIKNDIGDATLFWMLRHDKIRQPAARDWGATNPNLTNEARAGLNAACDALAAPNIPLPTSRARACADMIRSLYDDGTTPSGSAGWQHATTATAHQPYLWGAQLMAGYTPDQIRSFAQSAFDENTHASVGAVQTVGSFRDAPGFIRIYPAMQDLVAALRENGFDVWMVSASQQSAVEVVGAALGVSADHVIGIRMGVDPQGRLTTAARGCGRVRDGENTLIPYGGGKRCWIQHEIFHRRDANALTRTADPLQRQVFAAGDSDSDTAMLQDARVKLVINRNRTELMCNAYGNAGGRWLIEPMFIAPLQRHVDPYACSTTTGLDGNPIVDEAGSRIHDQLDRVFANP